jgi:hypothetical protein
MDRRHAPAPSKSNVQVKDDGKTTSWCDAEDVKNQKIFLWMPHPDNNFRVISTSILCRRIYIYIGSYIRIYFALNAY